LLVENQANLNIQDINGKTPLHYATSNLDIVKLLVDNQANLNLEYINGKTALHYASRNSTKSLDVVEYLKSKGGH
jgi:ankyrin repeat protein